MKSTSEIKHLVLIEESGIAKGIRRIVAVTGEDARTVTQQANDLGLRLTKILELPIKEREQALKLFSVVRSLSFSFSKARTLEVDEVLL